MPEPESPPRFSIVVPCYDVREWLPDCLDSVLGQELSDGAGLEVIAVDDASPDGLIDILRSYERSDDRLTVVHLRDNVGLGLARNAGLEHARGEYVMFLDSDDTFAPGALAALDARLTATGNPDVLVYDHIRTWTDGHQQPDARSSAAVALREPEVFVATERRDLLSILMVVWNKAYRRDFVDELGLEFYPGYYEDLTWTYESLLSAAAIATSPEVVVHYRQRPAGGNILATRSRRHFEVFHQYDRLFAWLAERPALTAAWHGFLFERMLDQALAIIASPDRIIPDARHDFFTAAHAAAIRHRPVGYRAKATRRDLKRRLVIAGRWRAYALLAASARTLRRVRGGIHTTSARLRGTQNRKTP